MSLEERTQQIKRIVVANKVVICLQAVLFAVSIVLNFTHGNEGAFIGLFVHIAVFVLYNIVVENFVDYGYLRVKYINLCAAVNPLQPIKLKIKIYKTAREKEDFITTTLLSQTANKTSLALANFVAVLVMMMFD